MKSRSAFWYPGWGSLWCAGHLEPMAAREHALVIKSPGSRAGSTLWSHWQSILCHAKTPKGQAASCSMWYSWVCAVLPMLVAHIVPGCRGGPRPLVVLRFGLIHRDFHWNGPIFRFTFSPAQWASPQLNGPVQRSSDRDSWLTGPYWPVGRRRKKKCLWPTLYQFLSCRRMRDLDRSRGPRACISQIGQRQKDPPIHVNLPGPKTQCEWVISAVLW